MMTWLVTIRAIRGYLSEAHKAQTQFNEAAADMKKAASDLCSRWEGDAANAFAREQEVFNGWCSKMDGTASEYMTVLNKAIDAYEQAELKVKKIISSK